MTSPTLTVASYNMRKAIGTDRRRNPDRVLAVLKEIDADVVALQEADRRFGSRTSAIPLSMIESRSPYKPVDFDVRPDGIGWHGNALLVTGVYRADGRTGQGVSLAARTRDGWGTPVEVPVPGLQNRSQYVNYYLSQDGQALLMSIQKDGGRGDRDLWVSLRSGVSRM